jgi:tetraacyldisaccharide 4'-kinase
MGLRPLSWLYDGATRGRNAWFDRAPLREAPLPALSVGNLTVGGTGKTPVASWFAQQLVARGAAPALVLRGYGDDEWRVHQLLNPAVPVIVSADRLDGMRRAKAQGCDCVVLDDAFQHRQAPRVSDVVLVNADRWRLPARLLPAGPYREAWPGLARATTLVVTVKGPMDQVEAILGAAARVAPQLSVAVVRLVPGGMHAVTAAADLVHGGERQDITRLLSGGWRMVSSIADPEAFARQLRAVGAQVVEEQRWPDHHAFTPADIARASASGWGVDGVVCTLKDAVKLAPHWPRAGVPLWYVSQTLMVERGADLLERECDRVLAARVTVRPTTG